MAKSVNNETETPPVITQEDTYTSKTQTAKKVILDCTKCRVTFGNGPARTGVNSLTAVNSNVITISRILSPACCAVVPETNIQFSCARRHFIKWLRKEFIRLIGQAAK